MTSLQDAMIEYKRQLEKGLIQQAYSGLMAYMLSLKNHFQQANPDWSVSGSLYFGYMDMTYFPIIPPFFRERKLKPAIVFVHETFRFEVWLAAVNKTIQNEYWQLLKDSDWDRYPIVSSTQGHDAVIEHILVENPDFSDLDALTQQIEQGTLTFIHDLQQFLAGI